jgi:hypothetical protein
VRQILTVGRQRGQQALPAVDGDSVLRFTSHLPSPYRA